MRSLRTTTKSSPRSLQPGKARAQQRRHNTAKNKIKLKKYIHLKKKEKKKKRNVPLINFFEYDSATVGSFKFSILTSGLYKVQNSMKSILMHTNYTDFSLKSLLFSKTVVK